jgi:hypothetical protein
MKIKLISILFIISSSFFTTNSFSTDKKIISETSIGTNGFFRELIDTYSPLAGFSQTFLYKLPKNFAVGISGYLGIFTPNNFDAPEKVYEKYYYWDLSLEFRQFIDINDSLELFYLFQLGYAHHNYKEDDIAFIPPEKKYVSTGKNIGFGIGINYKFMKNVYFGGNIKYKKSHIDESCLTQNNTTICGDSTEDLDIWFLGISVTYILSF